MKPCTLSISVEYMQREGDRWHKSVRDWVENYCRRNDIPMEVKEKLAWRDFEDYLFLTFKSEHQMGYFQRIGNAEFPYFEFL